MKLPKGKKRTKYLVNKCQNKFTYHRAIFRRFVARSGRYLGNKNGEQKLILVLLIFVLIVILTEKSKLRIVRNQFRGNCTYFDTY